MRNLKKLASLLLALVMVLSLTVTASAYTIKLNGSADTPVDGHSYTVYQIFTGELFEGKLSNIKYGKNFHPDIPATDDSDAVEVKEGDPVPESMINSIDEARDFADDLMNKADTNNIDIEGTAYGTLDSNYELSNVPAGYYLIVDEGPLGEGDSYSAYIVEVVDNVDIFPKSGAITSDKTIDEDSYEDNNDVNKDNEADDSVADSNKTNNSGVGSVVDYTLTVNLPANTGSYEYYFCVLNDTLAPGLDFNETSVKVTASTKGVLEAGAGKDYILHTGTSAGEYTFQIAMLNAKELAGQTITVTYNATVTKDAVLGVVGNPNKFTVDYSNNPNFDYDDDNGDGKPDDDEQGQIGEIPEKKTITYVTGIKLRKFDEHAQVLTGAEFEISGTSIKKVIVTGTEYQAVEEGTGDHYKLKDGRYTDKDPILDDKYEAKTGDRDGGYVYNEDTKTYTIATEAQLKDRTIQLFTKTFANKDLYATLTKDYKKVTIDEEVEVSEQIKATAFVDSTGMLTFKGLGEGIYTITEITTPAGYNSLEAPITVEIRWTAPAEGSEECTWEAFSPYAVASNNTTGELNMESASGVFVLDVYNRSGSTLPETGGMGTTLFYIAGGILVLAAVVLLVTKKRMQNAE